MTKRGLSKRERILFFIALLLLLTYLTVQFAIYPLFSKYIDGTQERNQLITERAQVEADLLNAAEIEERNMAAIVKYEQILQGYPAFIPNEEIDRILTDLCITNGLKPTALRFTNSFGAPQPGDDSDDQLEDSYLFTVVVATMNMTGNYSSLVELVDDITEMQFIHITNLGYSVNNNSISEDENANITMAFELTFTNP
ncbi:MAG: hypothetical protein FWD05_00475 [Oscillospiraceae bacterium]|nr:hypothetical protein [Oscillospiraceae bacterium]